MSVQEVLEAVKELSPEEREQVKRLLDSLPPTKDITRAVQAANERLLAAGMMSEIKPPVKDLTPYRERQPVPIKGEPLSRTIIEDRR